MRRTLPPMLLAVAGAACATGPARVIVPGPYPAQVAVTQQRNAACVAASTWTQCHDGVNLHTFAFSADGASLAYAAHSRGEWTVVHDGRAGAPWPGVGAPVLSADGRRVAYPAWDGRSWRVVVDGVAGPAWDELLVGSITFNAAGNRHAYAGRRAGAVHVVVDGAVSDAWDGVARIMFSPSGSAVAWVARNDASAMVVVNGIPGSLHDDVSELALDDGRYAYSARDGEAWWVIHDMYGPREDGSREDGSREDGSRGTGGWSAYGPYEAVSHVAVARSVWFVARRGDRAAAWRDGEALSWHDAVGAPVLGNAPDAWAYAARDAGASTMIVAGRTVGREAVIADVAISADAARYAFVASDSTGGFIVDDAGRYPFARVVEATLRFSPCGYWSALVLPAGGAHELRVAVDGALTPVRLGAADLVRLARRAAPRGALQSWVASAAAHSRGTPQC
jgi:hypothetical protein